MHEYFKNLQVKEIAAAKIKVDYRPSRLVESIVGLESDEYIELGPGDLSVLGTYRAHKRHGPQVPVHIPRSREACLEDEINIGDRITNALRRPKFNARGYGWSGIRDNTHRIIPLLSLVEGLEIYALMHCDIHSTVYGNKADVGVPSRKRMKSYEFSLKSLPLETSANAYADVVELAGTANTGDKRFHGNISHAYTISEIRFVPEEIAAFYKTAEEVEIAQNPFAIPTQFTIDFMQKAKDSVVKKPKLNRRVLNKTEQELLLWRLVDSYGAEKTFTTDNDATQALLMMDSIRQLVPV